MTMNDFGYVIITSYAKPDTGADVTADIQRAIDENPNKTIYFPDGEYLISAPIRTPADPVKSVCLKLSAYAKLKAVADWAHDDPMVCLGSIHAANDINTPGSNYFFEGGIIDGSDVASGIAIDGGRETVIRDVSIKRTFIGVALRHGANSNSSDADIHSVNIVGNGKKGSVGVLVRTSDNSYTNMRIASVQYGVKIERGGTNIFRNVHPLFIYERELTDLYADSYGFWDNGGGTWYDNCYSDNFATGFYVGNGTRNVYNTCIAYWYSARGEKEVGFEFASKMNAVINSCTVNFKFPELQGKYMTVAEEGGVGAVILPYTTEEFNHDDTFKKYMGENHVVDWRKGK